MHKKRSRVFNILISLVVIAVLVLLVYSYLTYKNSVSESGEDFVVCDQKGNCLIAMHIHTAVEISVCGNRVKLPPEAGDKTGTHTHKERDLLHFEERLKYDNLTQTILDKEPITLKTFFNHPDVNIKFNSTCISDKCNGDLCNGSPGEIKFFVNNQTNNEFENYVWKDRDKIKIIFE